MDVGASGFSSLSFKFSFNFLPLGIPAYPPTNAFFRKSNLLLKFCLAVMFLICKFSIFFLQSTIVSVHGCDTFFFC